MNQKQVSPIYLKIKENIADRSNALLEKVDKILK